jgi:hypothetical protein
MQEDFDFSPAQGDTGQPQINLRHLAQGGQCRFICLKAESSAPV